MNASQFLAWILCLALAFFASALAVRNGYKTALLEKEFAAVQKSAEDSRELLRDVRDVLQSIDRHLAEEKGVRAPAGQTPAVSAPVRRAPIGQAP
jgi:hypothetical protein